MAKVFLDTNFFIDLVEERQQVDVSQFSIHQLLISPLSVHILFYVMKRKVPYEKLSALIEKFYLIQFDDLIAQKSLTGPTEDFEDNVQLHSAIESKSNIFLTSDKKLLKMKFFGKVRVVESLV